MAASNGGEVAAGDLAGAACGHAGRAHLGERAADVHDVAHGLDHPGDAVGLPARCGVRRHRRQGLPRSRRGRSPGDEPCHRQHGDGSGRPRPHPSAHRALLSFEPDPTPSDVAFCDDRIRLTAITAFRGPVPELCVTDRPPRSHDRRHDAPDDLERHPAATGGRVRFARSWSGRGAGRGTGRRAVPSRAPRRDELPGPPLARAGGGLRSSVSARRQPEVDVRSLSGFTGAGYDRGRPLPVQAAWVLVQHLVFVKWWFPARLRPAVLRAFGARVGEGVVVRSRVRVHWPWKLEVGDHCWIGEGAWVLNLEPVADRPRRLRLPGRAAVHRQPRPEQPDLRVRQRPHHAARRLLGRRPRRGAARGDGRPRGGGGRRRGGAPGPGRRRGAGGRHPRCGSTGSATRAR